MFGLRLIDNARRDLHRFWSIRLSIFFGVLNGAALGLTAFTDVFNPWFFMGLNAMVYGVIALSRLVKQTDPPAPVEPAEAP